ncbi:MAG: SpoIIE family protein phosphatase [Pyrinomonadaceae bacterium]
MTNRRLLLALLAVTFLFAGTALVKHYSHISERYRISFRTANLPIGNSDGKVSTVMPDAEAAGVRLGDRIESVNGVPIAVDADWANLIANLEPDQEIPVVLIRNGASGDESVQVTLRTRPAARDLGFFAGFITSFLYSYAIPTISILLAFWVVFIRPTDPLAWILLLVLLGMSSVSFEGYPEKTFIGFYRGVFFSGWALGMLLFGTYFPEQWSADRKFPWAKWILIVPLIFQAFLILNTQIRRFVGFDITDYIEPIVHLYDSVGFYVNMLAIGSFFGILGHKSGTLENPDSRRRLKLLVWGTAVAMLPTFLIVLYKGVYKVPGSFFQAVPFWIAIVALLLLNLFPLTLAYVIVVQQAMDVRVVVRQGIQYGLAKGGIRFLQFFLLLGVGLAVRWSINNYGNSFAAQFAFIVGGIALVPLIEYFAKPLRVWIDKRFFRDAYNSEQILLELSEDVRTMVETRPLLETVSARISESLHVRQIALLIKNGAGYEPAYSIGYDTPPLSVLGENTRAVQTLKGNQHILIRDVNVESTSTPTIMPDERKQIEDLNSQILLPLAVKGHLSGILSLSSKRSEEPFTPSDLRLLKSVAAQTGLALENSRLTASIASEAAQKERLNREVEIAREVQERLFPQEFPDVDGLEYYGHCRPALGVGGDYYDFLELPDGKFGFAIGDVSGKGIGAALMMASLQASLRGQAIHSGDDLSSLMSNVNRLIYEASTSNRYATFFYAQFEATTRKLAYVNAGHNPPFLLRCGVDEPILLTEGGPVIGMLPPMLVSYSQGEIELKEGDLIVGFTDGISEAMNPNEEEWGEDALLAKLKTLLDRTPTEINDRCVDAADRFADGAKQHDDMTMIVLRVL